MQVSQRQLLQQPPPLPLLSPFVWSLLLICLLAQPCYVGVIAVWRQLSEGPDMLFFFLGQPLLGGLLVVVWSVLYHWLMTRSLSAIHAVRGLLTAMSVTAGMMLAIWMLLGSIINDTDRTGFVTTLFLKFIESPIAWFNLTVTTSVLGSSFGLVRRVERTIAGRITPIS